MTTVIKDLSLTKEMDANEMAATEGGRMIIVNQYHNLSNYGPKPINVPGIPELAAMAAEALDDY
jgi:hypothetical protein